MNISKKLDILASSQKKIFHSIQQESSKSIHISSIIHLLFIHFLYYPFIVILTKCSNHLNNSIFAFSNKLNLALHLLLIVLFLILSIFIRQHYQTSYFHYIYHLTLPNIQHLYFTATQHSKSYNSHTYQLLLQYLHFSILISLSSISKILFFLCAELTSF